LDDKWKTEGQQWLALVWDLIDRLASIGAHQAWGYGQIRLENLKLTQFSLDDVHSTHNTGWPDLADFVFAEYEFDHPVTLSPLSGRKFFKERPLWDTKNKTPALMTPVGLSLRYLLHYPENCIRCPTTIKSWDTLFFGDKGKEDPAGRFNGSLLYRVDSKGNPDTHGEKYRFRVWAWLPKNIFNGETDGLPAWCDAAKMLRDVLQNDDLWNAVAGCKPPDECYFWPLKNAKLIPALRRIAPLLGVIEDRARSSLKRTCI
jgi:hypothetical protein